MLGHAGELLAQGRVGQGFHRDGLRNHQQDEHPDGYARQGANGYQKSVEQVHRTRCYCTLRDGVVAGNSMPITPTLISLATRPICS